MKLFVWNNPYEVSYGGSCLYVLAKNLREARKLAKASVDAGFGNQWGTDPIKINVDSVKPTRVISKPYAEVYHWSE